MAASAKWGAGCSRAEMSMENAHSRTSGRFRARASTGVPLVGLAVLLSGCFLTDQSRDELTTGDLHFPASGYAQTDTSELPRIAFDRTMHDMGKIAQGQRVEMRFPFTNTGGSPLVISAVNGSCGCTVGKDWPTRPMAPGESGEITVVFDSAGRSGKQNKTVSVVTNSRRPTTVLIITGEVIGPASTDQH